MTDVVLSPITFTLTGLVTLAKAGRRIPAALALYNSEVAKLSDEQHAELDRLLTQEGL